MSHTWMSHITHMDESRRAYECVIWTKKNHHVLGLAGPRVHKVGDVGGVGRGWGSATMGHSHNGGWSGWKKKESTSFNWEEVRFSGKSDFLEVASH